MSLLGMWRSNTQQRMCHLQHAALGCVGALLIIFVFRTRMEVFPRSSYRIEWAVKTQLQRVGHEQQSRHADTTGIWPRELPPVPWPFSGVTGCYSEADVTLCSWCNSTFSQQHPITEADYQRAYIPGSPCSMPARLIEKLWSGKEALTITVVGGSMTEGVNCIDGERVRRQCSWPSRMQDRLQQLFPAANITLRNEARPSWSYTSWLESGLIEAVTDTDILLVDLQVNSQVYKQDIMREMEEVDIFMYSLLEAAQRQHQPVGVMFVENFLSCGNWTVVCDAHCPESQQGRIPYNIAGQNMTFGYCNRYWTMASFERPVVQHYQIPIASYRDAVWPSFAHPRPVLPCFWNGFSHPDGVGHLLVGDVVTYALVQALVGGHKTGDGCEDQQYTRFHSRLPVLRYCTAPPTGVSGGDNDTHEGTFMTPEHPQSFQPLWVTGAWLFREDKPKKPGWILEPGFHSKNTSRLNLQPSPTVATLVNTTVDGVDASLYNSNAIWFKVVFSSQPQLQVTYLTSYLQIGVAELAIYNQTGSPLAVYTLDGRTKDKYSIPRTTVLIHPSRPSKIRGETVHHFPKQVQQGHYVVALRPLNGTKLQGSKFKLLGIASC